MPNNQKPDGKGDPFSSLNPETGLLEDIDEVRDAGLIAVGFVKHLVMSPGMQFMLPMPMKIDLAATIISVESMLQPISQAAYMRQLALMIYGKITPQMEYAIRQRGYSEVLPSSHPDAPRPDISDIALSPNDPIVKRSAILTSLLAEDENRTQPLEEKAIPEQHTQLPPEVENLLRQLGFDDDDHPMNDGGDGQASDQFGG